MMADTPRDEIAVRPLKSEDFDALVQLDGILLQGEDRKEYWEKKFAVFRLRHPNLSLVATVDERVVGYVMGNISGWEFGVRSGIGWVELIGVHPDVQRGGIAKELTLELLRQFKALNVKTVYTMVMASDPIIRRLFHSVGFQEGRMVQLEKNLG